MAQPLLAGQFTGQRRPGLLPIEPNSFVGRAAEAQRLTALLRSARLVTVVGPGGVGKSRLCLHIASAALSAGRFADGVVLVELSTVTDPALLASKVAAGLGLPERDAGQQRAAVLDHVRDRRMLLILDTCEHLVDACAAFSEALLRAAPEVTVLATSRQPFDAPGEHAFPVAPLPIEADAVELFAQRAAAAAPGFAVTAANRADVVRLCRRLDGMPLAIELAAARVRALSLRQICDSLNDRFRLLTGGARNALRRQQTLRASVDWSHALLTEPERTLFRRLGVFMGGFDLDAAQAVATTTEAEQFQILDQLSLLVDKSLVIADDDSAAMRYRLLETMRQYALEKLSESGEADTVRDRHRDHYVGAAMALEDDDQRIVKWAEDEIDNLRAAHTWGLETSEFESALRLTSSLQRLWVTRGRMREGIAGFDRVFSDDRYRDAEVEPAVWVRAVAYMATLAAWISAPSSLERAQEALAAAREIGDKSLIALCLASCGAVAYFSPEVARPYLMEAVSLARASGDRVILCDVCSYLAFAGHAAGEPAACRPPPRRGVTSPTCSVTGSGHGRAGRGWVFRWASRAT
jgi:predicted ATPase